MRVQGHRLLILATTSRRSVLDQLDMLEAFDRQIAVPAVSDLQELSTALRELNALDPADANQALNTLRQTNRSDHVGVGIKTVLTMAESAAMVDEPAAWFAEQLGRAIITNNPRT